MDTPPPFVIFALPRSRTFWCSQYLSYMNWYCGHEQLLHLRSLEDVKSWLAMPATGTAETGVAPFWRLLRHYRPDARIVTIRRPIEPIVDSLMAKGWPDAERLRHMLVRLDHKLDQIEARCDCMSLRFEDLALEDTCARLFEYCCVPYVHDTEWWQFMSPRNLQINLSGMVRYLHAHASQLDKLTKLAKHRSIRLMQQGTDYNDGIVFEAELFNDFYRDGAALFDEHCAAVGEAPDAWQAKNKALYRRLEELGALQCLTARCNGRMFGYLVSVIAPSLDDPNIQNAEHTLFYAEPGVRNLGMRLQRQALERLRARGIANVMMRAGDRGSGPRLGAIYRRLGAEPYGELYRMPLEEAA